MENTRDIINTQQQQRSSNWQQFFSLFQFHFVCFFVVLNSHRVSSVTNWNISVKAERTTWFGVATWHCRSLYFAFFLKFNVVDDFTQKLNQILNFVLHFNSMMTLDFDCCLHFANERAKRKRNIVQKHAFSRFFIQSSHVRQFNRISSGFRNCIFSQ